MSSSVIKPHLNTSDARLICWGVVIVRLKQSKIFRHSGVSRELSKRWLIELTDWYWTTKLFGKRLARTPVTSPSTLRCLRQKAREKMIEASREAPGITISSWSTIEHFAEVLCKELQHGLKAKTWRSSHVQIDFSDATLTGKAGGQSFLWAHWRQFDSHVISNPWPQAVYSSCRHIVCLWDTRKRKILRWKQHRTLKS